MQISHFAYLFFHLSIIISLVVGKMVYKKMLVPTKTEVLSFLPVSVLFIVWDYLVTDIWWQFNPRFVMEFTHIDVIRLPLEELLFFVVVPYALVTFLKNIYALMPKAELTVSSQLGWWLQGLYRGVLLLLVYFLFSQEWWYTFVVVVALALTDVRILKNRAIALGLLFTLCTTLIFNYYLTSLPIVLYSEIYKTGVLVGTIPIEDFGYAALLYLWIVKAQYATKNTYLFAT